MAKRLPDDVMDYFRKQGARGGKLGGGKSWEGLTTAQRSARAGKASQAAAAARTKKRAKAKG